MTSSGSASSFTLTTLLTMATRVANRQVEMVWGRINTSIKARIKRGRDAATGQYMHKEDARRHGKTGTERGTGTSGGRTSFSCSSVEFTVATMQVRQLPPRLSFRSQVMRLLR